jgi:chromosome segregation ATPase
VSYDEVAAVADAITAENINPTISNVREQLGTGSRKTIHRHLAMWREQRPQIVTTQSELPVSIVNEISREITRAKCEARAEIEEKLVICQAEAADLAATGEALESKMESLREEFNALVTHRDRLQCQIQEQAAETERLTRENERERYGAEQARIEVAQARIKTTEQAGKIVEMSSLLEKLKAENAAESTAKTGAEKNVAVLAAKLESEQKATDKLMLENDELRSKLDSERQSAESARLEAAKQASAYHAQYVTLSECVAARKELSELYEIEKAARLRADIALETLAERLDMADGKNGKHAQVSVPDSTALET